MMKLLTGTRQGRRVGLGFLGCAAALLLTACATVAPRPPTLNIPQSLRLPCEHPDPSKVSTIGDLAGFSLKQDAAIAICDARRSAVVAIVDGANPKPRKRFLIF